MDVEFWHERWANNQIGFHQRDVNALMIAHFKALRIAQGARVFVPLCGKSHDIGWLLSQGYEVVGSELSAIAINNLFKDLGVEPVISAIGDLQRHDASGISILVGDIFDLTADMFGKIDAVYDRAALVALSADMRADYARHVHMITGGAPQFLLCLEYDQSVMTGPPFAVDAEEVARVHGGHYDLSLIASANVVGGLKGICPALETAWLLR